MKLLALDTTTEKASLALLVETKLITRSKLGQRSHAQFLLPLIEEMMREGGVGFADLDGIVYGRGPGSFTGLRVACSVAKGLAFPYQLPLFPVSSLMAIAWEARVDQDLTEQPVLALIDARMKELYWAYFATKQLEAREQVSAAEKIMIDPLPDKLILAGLGYEDYYADLPSDLTDRITKTLTVYPEAAAEIALVQAGLIKPVTVAEAAPVYIRNQVTQGEPRG